MQTQNRMAFKEWSVVCAALADGRQTVIVRKGGIHEGRAGFRVAHHEFWLFPTFLHQNADSLVADARPLLDRVLQSQPDENIVSIGTYAVVADVHELHDAAQLSALAGLQILTPATLDERFQYRQPGLFVLTVRMRHVPRNFEVPNSPHLAGCRSWVDLPEELPTGGAFPVLSDDDFARQRDAIRNLLRPSALA